MKKMLSLLLAFSLLSTPAALAADTPSSWAKAEVEAAQAAGLIPTLTGSPAYTDAITREQFAELSVQTITVLSPKGDAFFDAAKAQTFSDCDNPAVRLASAAGVVNGTGGGKFEPKQTTNREQIAAMVYRAVAALNADKEHPLGLTLAASDLSKFSDKAQVSAWAADSLGALAASGVLNGTSATQISPKESCTVEQAILLLYRVYARATGATEPAEPNDPPQGETAFYSDYPAVPDFGAFYGIPDSQMERIVAADTPYYEYSSVELDPERIAAYQALLEQEGFYWVEHEKAFKRYNFRNPAHSDYLVSLQLAGGGVVRVIFYPTMSAVSAPRNYPDGPGNVPDLAAAVGLSLHDRQESNGAVQYNYLANADALYGHSPAWCDQMLNAGFRLKGIEEGTDLHVWYSADEKWFVKSGLINSGYYYAIAIIPAP